MAAVETLPPTDIDATRLSSFLDIDVPDLQSIIDSATEEIRFLLCQVQVKVTDYEQIRQAKDLLEINYQQEVHTTTVKVTSMREQLQKSIQETHELRTKLNTLESERSSGVSEVTLLKSQNATLEESISRQKMRIETLEVTHKDTLALLEKKSTEIARNEEEYKQLQAKHMEVRRELANSETALQEAQGQISTLTYKEQSLQQEAEFLKRDNERLASELNTKATDFSNYRKEKSAQVTQLESELEEVSATASANAEQNRSLKRRLEETSQKLERELAKNAELSDQITAQVENHRSELSSQTRLAELWERSCKETQERNRDLENQLEREQERTAEEVAQWQTKAQAEEARAVEAENRVQELEREVERLEATLETNAAVVLHSPTGQNGHGRGGPSTPSNRTPFSPTSSTGMFSPSAQAIAKRGSSGMSLTQLYSELHAAKQAETLQRRRADKLQEEYEQYREEAERWAPEYQNMIQEFEQQKDDLATMSINLQNAITEKEEAERQLRLMRNTIMDKERETRLYHQQSRDLGRQVQHLLRELHERDAGLNGDLTEEERQVMQQMNEAYEAGLDFTDTDKIISQRLTIFHNIGELQQQNQNLLRVTRELGQKMEEDEKEYQSKMENLESEALNKATEVINQLRDELKSMRTKMDSYIRERDMFRRMATGKGPAGTEAQADVTQSTQAAAAEEQTNLLREMQVQFDAYRNEAAIDQRTLNDQIRSLTAERAEALINANKYKSQMELANERYKILQGNMEMVKQEAEELKKRLQRMQEQQARQDVKVQQAAEELVDVRGMVDSLRTENANLKAEKALFKSIEQRLQNDNEQLSSERTRLNTLLSNLQIMQNERERQESESRRRNLEETERLEKEIQTLKSKVSEEAEETRRVSSRREFETRELQERIDKLNAELAMTKEHLAAATTARDQLQARVEEQGILLKSSEDKLAALSRSDSAQDVNHEQQLGIEVAELKKSLELTRTELRDAKEYAEKMKEIAATAEEALQDMNTTHDSFKEEIDKQLAEKDGEIARFKERIEILTSELETSNQELSHIRQKEEERRHTMEQENKTLQAEIARLKDVEDKAQLQQGFYQEDLRAQAHIAQEAQRNYERELVKHAEAAQTVQQLREEIGNLRTEIRTLRTEAETATAALQSSESSWETQKADYERELWELRTRAEDLVKQNNILHQQFETVASQAQQIRQRTEANLSALETDAAAQGTPAGKEDSIEGLREVIKYLRREKEIVDIKHEVLQQENRRLKQQLDRTTTELDETRMLLMSEREKTASAATSSVQHQELLAKINELNLLRESNVTLRSENERNTKRVAELEARVVALTAQLSPLEEKIRSLEAEIESKDDQIRLLTEDNERWKSRNQQILQKYERIDPVELQNLKDQLEAANNEKKNLEAQLQEANNKNRAVADAWRTKHDRAVASAKTRLDQNRETIESLEARIAASAKDSADGNAQLETAKAQVESVRQELTQQIATLQSELEKLKENPVTTPPDAAIWEAEKKSFEERINAKDAEITRISQLARATERAKVFQPEATADGQRESAAKITALEEELAKLTAQSAQLSLESPDFEQRVIQEVQRRLTENASPDTTTQAEAIAQQRIAELENTHQHALADAARAAQEAADARIAEILSAKDKEIAELRAGGGEITDLNARIAEAVQAREAELKEFYEKEVKAAEEAALKRFKQPTQDKILAAAAKHGEKLFQERWAKFQEEQAAGAGAGEAAPLSQEAIDKAVDDATKKKDEEYAEKLQKAAEGAKNEAEMRNKLQMGKLQKQILDTKAKLDSYEKQFGPLPGTPQIPPTPPQPGQQVHPYGQPMPPQLQTPTPINIVGAGHGPPAANVLQKLQAGRGGGIPQRARGGGQQQGVGRGGPGQGRGQRLSGQYPPQGQLQGQRPAVNRPVPANTAGPGQQRRQSGQQQQQSQSQLPRPAGQLNAGAAPFQPGGMKRTRDDEGQGAQNAGQKRTRVAGNAEGGGTEGQS